MPWYIPILRATLPPASAVTVIESVQCVCVGLWDLCCALPQRYRTTLCTTDLRCAPPTCIVHHRTRPGVHVCQSIRARGLLGLYVLNMEGASMLRHFFFTRELALPVRQPLTQGSNSTHGSTKMLIAIKCKPFQSPDYAHVQYSKANTGLDMASAHSKFQVCARAQKFEFTATRLF